LSKSVRRYIHNLTVNSSEQVPVGIGAALRIVLARAEEPMKTMSLSIFIPPQCLKTGHNAFTEYIHAKTYRHFGRRRQQLLLDIFGWRQVDERFTTSREVFHNVGADAEFRAYEGVGHSTPENVQRDVVEFHRREMRAEYGPPPETETQTEGQPTTGDEPEVEGTVSADGPGFGIPTALGALVSAGYLLWPRLVGDTSERGD
jgi:hypothetical protein